MPDRVGSAWSNGEGKTNMAEEATPLGVEAREAGPVILIRKG